MLTPRRRALSNVKNQIPDHENSFFHTTTNPERPLFRLRRIQKDRNWIRRKLGYLKNTRPDGIELLLSLLVTIAFLTSGEAAHVLIKSSAVRNQMQ